MSLSTQLARGTLAVPMLILFAALGVIAGRDVEADLVHVAKAELLSQVCAAPAQRSRVLVLAQAPADLGALLIRRSAACRA